MFCLKLLLMTLKQFSYKLTKIAMHRPDTNVNKLHKSNEATKQMVNSNKMICARP